MATINDYPGLSYLKAVNPSGELVNFVADVDFAEGCLSPWVLPLRTRLLWQTARIADLANRFPEVGEKLVYKRSAKRGGQRSGEGLVADAVIESVKVRCGRCQNCANLRKSRWLRAANGFLAGADLSLFYTLTFSDRYFEARVKRDVDMDVRVFRRNIKDSAGTLTEKEALAETQRVYLDDQLRKCVGYNALSGEHDAHARAFMCQDRQKMMKLLRHHLSKGRFGGAKLVGQMSVYEYGDTRGRLHLHGLMHFTLPVNSDRFEIFRELKEFILSDWVRRDVGVEQAQDIQLYEPGTSEKTAAYCLNYLLKYEASAEGKRVLKSRARLACSTGYRKLGTIAYYAAFPKLIPGGMLREVTPREVSDISMKAAAKREDWRYGEDVILAVASQAAWARLKPEQRDLALALARAAMINLDCELGPIEMRDDGTAPDYDEHGEFKEDAPTMVPEMECPPDPFELAGWIQGQLRAEVVGEKHYRPDIVREDGSDVEDAS